MSIGTLPVLWDIVQYSVSICSQCSCCQEEQPCVWDSGRELVPGVTRHLEGEYVGPLMMKKIDGLLLFSP